MKTIYRSQQNIISDSGLQAITYGIAVTDENGIPLRTVSDIFGNISDADKFAKLCTELELSPEHLDDVIQDVLAAN